MAVKKERQVHLSSSAKRNVEGDGLVEPEENCCDLSQARYFCIMSDECTDASNREQLVMCIRWVDSNFEPHEGFSVCIR